ncbi:MAG: hypothetical protein FWD23_10515 [Oscillospiraceae bacterium]|nr:hypothetical protein [Oscillospiraceae bacterium]
MKKAYFAFIIVFAFFISYTVCSCGPGSSPDAPESKTEESTSPGAQTEDIDPRLLIGDDLPDTDLEGYTFRIYTHNYAAGGHADYVIDYNPESQSGEVIADSVYLRNRTVEERFNCNVVTSDSGADNDISAHSQKIKKTVISGEDAFDVALEHCILGCNLSLEGLFINLLEIPHFNFEKPWWYKNTNDEMTVMGQMYMGSNAIFYSGIAQTWALYVNKNLIADFGLQMPYQDVFEGSWTMDKLIALTKDVYVDVNGDGARDGGDVYGFVALSVESNFFTANEMPILKKTEEGVEIVVNNQRTFDLIEMLYDWFYGSSGCNTPAYGTLTDGMEVYEYVHWALSNNKALIVSGMIGDAVKHYRSAEIAYGLLPYPKYDMNQKNYRSFANDEFFVVPTTAPDLSRTGLLIEALAAEGYKQIYPAYYEVALKKKYMHDDESIQILDIIVNSRNIAFSYTYDNWQGYGHMLNDLFTAKPTKDFASYYEKRLGSAQKRVDQINNSFAGMQK